MLLPYLEALRDNGKQPEFFMQLLKIEQWLESREQYLSRVRLSGPVREASETLSNASQSASAQVIANRFKEEMNAMRYETPELLLVGPANSLVLGAVCSGVRPSSRGRSEKER